MIAVRFRAWAGRRLALACLGAAILSGAALPAHAGPLPAGGSVKNDSVPASAGAGSLKADSGPLPYILKDAFGTVVGSGTVREIVISDPSNALGGLDYLIQFSVATGTVGSISTTSYKGFTTDASAVDSSVQNPKNPPGTVAW